MKQRMKPLYPRLAHALGNSTGSIMLTTLVLMLAVTVVAVGLNTSIMTTAEDTYDQYYETQSYYTARSVATAIAEEISAQSDAEYQTIDAESASYTSVDDVKTSHALLTAMAKLRDPASGLSEVTLNDISFDSTNFVEGTGNYITAKITREDAGVVDDFDDDIYTVTVECEISGVTDIVSIELTTTEHAVSVGSSVGATTEVIDASFEGFFFDGFSSAFVGSSISKLDIDVQGDDFVTALPLTFLLTADSNDITFKGSLYCYSTIALSSTSKDIKFDSSSDVLVSKASILEGKNVTINNRDTADYTGTLPARCQPTWVGEAQEKYESGSYTKVTSSSITGNSSGAKFFVVSDTSRTISSISSSSDSSPAIIIVEPGCTLTVTTSTMAYYYLMGDAKLIFTSTSKANARIYADPISDDLIDEITAKINAALPSSGSALKDTATLTTAANAVQGIYESYENAGTYATVSFTGNMQEFYGSITAMLSSNINTSGSLKIYFSNYSSNSYGAGSTYSASADWANIETTTSAGGSEIAYYYTYDVYQYVKG